MNENYFCEDYENNIDLIEYIEKNEKKIELGFTDWKKTDESLYFIYSFEFLCEEKMKRNRAFLISCCIDKDLNIFKLLFNEIIGIYKFKYYVIEGLKFAYAYNTNE